MTPSEFSSSLLSYSPLRYFLSISQSDTIPYIPDQSPKAVKLTVAWQHGFDRSNEDRAGRHTPEHWSSVLLLKSQSAKRAISPTLQFHGGIGAKLDGNASTFLLIASALRVLASSTLGIPGAPILWRVVEMAGEEDGGVQAYNTYCHVCHPTMFSTKLQSWSLINVPRKRKKTKGKKNMKPAHKL